MPNGASWASEESGEPTSTGSSTGTARSPSRAPGSRLAARYAQERILRWMAWRGYGSGPEAQVVKLLRAEANMALQSLAVGLEGPRAAAHEGSDSETAEIVYGFLRSRANSIAGGTSEIMRNVIGEQLLGLPREPRPAQG